MGVFISTLTDLWTSCYCYRNSTLQMRKQKQVGFKQPFPQSSQLIEEFEPRFQSSASAFPKVQGVQLGLSGGVDVNT